MDLSILSCVGKKPTHYSLVCGVGNGPTELNSFDRALRGAGVGDYNLIKLSSILPPGILKGFKQDVPPPGDFLPIAYGSITHKVFQEKRILYAAVSIGSPYEDDIPGLIMEYTYVVHVVRDIGDRELEEVQEENYRFVRETVEKMVHTGMRDRRVVGYEVISRISVNVCDGTSHRNPYGTAFAGVILL